MKYLSESKQAIQVAPSTDLVPLRNVYACLVHERPECVIDLVRNLRHLDSYSRILLYDGSKGSKLLDPQLPWAQWGVELHPRPRMMKWGFLHEFAIDCLSYLQASAPFDILTVVDSDQLALRAGYTAYLTQHLRDKTHVGLLSSIPEQQGAYTRIPPALMAQQELALWRPFLRRFPGGEDKFVHWTFWPATVITADAGLAILELFEQDAELARILELSRLWATEEILFPTLAALLGFHVEQNPCAFDYIKYRKAFSVNNIDTALLQPDAFWLHPAPRRYNDPLRARIRNFHSDYFHAYFPTALIGQADERQLASLVPKQCDKADSPHAEANDISRNRQAKTGAETANGFDQHTGRPAFCSARVSKLAQLRQRWLGDLGFLLWDIVLKNANPKLITCFVPGAQVIAAVRAIQDGFKRLARLFVNILQLAKSAIDSVPAILDSRYLNIISSSMTETEFYKVLLANRVTNYLRRK